MRTVLTAGVGLVMIGSAGAQSLYKFRGADGLWVYSDRYPAGSFSGTPNASVTAGGVELREAAGVDSAPATVVAVNPYSAWVQIAWRIESSRNLDPAVPHAGNALLAPASETPLLSMLPADGAARATAGFGYQYIIGHPGARHRPDEPYRLPYRAAESYRITQAWPDALTHGAAADRHAVDFEMPVGTPVVAARAGVVVDLASGYDELAADAVSDPNRANFVRVLHDDGTLALYGHLARRSVRVTRGQRVARGQHIADSGNTGYSSGPHLHFVVQRNRAGALESVPVRFSGTGGTGFEPRTGDVPAAY